ncbi:hypothetical protein HanXRQr2_Chr03g0116131 [Helianthus annuus]|uniref:Uncharacterized protein n=1 Tax=Helianthus annuus TaxID=4232 RepID=A0A9K3NW88_HELAN|nr:hypothetical protein HanXRQr2_Chr03g0116131 [Helianthus annuus]
MLRGTPVMSAGCSLRTCAIRRLIFRPSRGSPPNSDILPLARSRL